MRPLVQKLTLPGRRSSFCPQLHPPYRWLESKPLNFCRRHLKNEIRRVYFLSAPLKKKSEPLGCGRKMERSRMVKQRRSPSKQKQ